MFEQKHLKRIYRLWAPVYDLVYHVPLASARKAALKAIPPGSRVLEVGIGTGLTLSGYPKGCKVVGIDLSFPMLKKANKRARQPSSPIEGLMVMDAYNLGFADNSFDVVISTFTVGVVPEPMGVLDEMARVLKPGGELIIANRFSAETTFSKLTEWLFGGIVKRIGWGGGLKFSRLVPWAEERGISLVSESRFLIGGMVRVIHLRQKWQEKQITYSHKTVLAKRIRGWNFPVPVRQTAM